MLVINGRLHPRFVHANVSLKQRSGMGIRDAQTLVFAISDNPVSFAAFARLFRDRTKCDNALFLDGGMRVVADEEPSHIILRSLRAEM